MTPCEFCGGDGYVLFDPSPVSGVSPYAVSVRADCPEGCERPAPKPPRPCVLCGQHAAKWSVFSLCPPHLEEFDAAKVEGAKTLGQKMDGWLALKAEELVAKVLSLVEAVPCER